MLALYGVVHLVNSCHLNIAHNNVECRTQPYNGTFAKSVWSLPPTAPLNNATIPPWSESLDKPLHLPAMPYNITLYVKNKTHSCTRCFVLCVHAKMCVHIQILCDCYFVLCCDLLRGLSAICCWINWLTDVPNVIHKMLTARVVKFKEFSLTFTGPRNNKV